MTTIRVLITINGTVTRGNKRGNDDGESVLIGPSPYYYYYYYDYDY